MICRRSGETGSSRPASSAIWPDQAPAAQTIVSVATSPRVVRDQAAVDAGDRAARHDRRPVRARAGGVALDDGVGRAVAVARAERRRQHVARCRSAGTGARPRRDRAAASARPATAAARRCARTRRRPRTSSAGTGSRPARGRSPSPAAARSPRRRRASAARSGCSARPRTARARRPRPSRSSPAPSIPRSSRSTSRAPASARWKAIDAPITPPPMTTAEADLGRSGIGRPLQGRAAGATLRGMTTVGEQTGGEVLATALEALGVELAFGLPGVHNLPAWAALNDSPIRLVGVRHEQAAVYAADGAARITGKLGVALTTTGPGAANALGATGEAYASGSPVLIIATDISTAHRTPGVYRGTLHETRDQGAMFEPVVKAVYKVRGPEDLTMLPLHAAAYGDEGAARAGLPRDPVRPAVEGGAAGDRRAARVAPSAARRHRARPTSATPRERPLIWAGGGARDAATEVRALAARLGAPVLETYQGRGIGGSQAAGLPPHHPDAGRLWDEADLVVSIGSDLDGINTQNWAQPRPPKLVVVNVDPADGEKNYPADVLVTADAAAGTQRADRGRRRARARGRPSRSTCPSSTTTASSRRSPRPSTRRPSSSPTCASPATGSPASAASPRRGGSATRWGGGRSASRSRPRSARRSRRTARRCACAATAASCSRPASSRSSPRSRCR